MEKKTKTKHGKDDSYLLVLHNNSNNVFFNPESM